jgi:glycosyltransferase involved in cell wall biosynthesis
MDFRRNAACIIHDVQERGPIVAPFCDQLSCFFDEQILVDHESVDTSLEIFKSRLPNCLIYSVSSTGFPQDHLANYALSVAFKELDVDYLFFLDCDEYLPFANKQALIEAIEHSGSKDIYQMPWKTIVPKKWRGGPAFAGGFWTMSNHSPFQKVIVSKNLFKNFPQMRIAKGYHSAIGIDAIVPTDFTHLLHCPFASATKFISKVKIWSSINPETDGLPWCNLYDKIQKGDLDDDGQQRKALLYPWIQDVGQLRDSLEFRFPYVLSDIDDKLDTGFNPARRSSNHEFTLKDAQGKIVAKSIDGVQTESHARDYSIPKKMCAFFRRSLISQKQCWRSQSRR